MAGKGILSMNEENVLELVVMWPVTNVLGTTELHTSDDAFHKKIKQGKYNSI